MSVLWQTSDWSIDWSACSWRRGVCRQEERDRERRMQREREKRDEERSRQRELERERRLQAEDAERVNRERERLRCLRWLSYIESKTFFEQQRRSDSCLVHGVAWRICD